jgi:hypothetical protein
MPLPSDSYRKIQQKHQKLIVSALKSLRQIIKKFIEINLKKIKKIVDLIK